jgi:hypothetical protein
MLKKSPFGNGRMPQKLCAIAHKKTGIKPVQIMPLHVGSSLSTLKQNSLPG